MDLNETSDGAVKVIAVRGRLDGSTAQVLGERLASSLVPASPKLVLELSQLEYISSAGLRAILVAVKRGKALGCPLAACGLRPNIREVFDLSGFGNLIPLHASVSEAVNS